MSGFDVFGFFVVLTVGVTYWMILRERERKAKEARDAEITRAWASGWGQAVEAAARCCETVQERTDKWGPMAGYCATKIRATLK